MPKGSPELTNARKEEIIAACAELYKTKSFKEITIKEIGNITSFTRTSIYNYFETKEEIFLALLQKEYESWSMELKNLTAENESFSVDEFSSAIAHSLEKHERLLKLLSMNHFDMEENSRIERLVEMKRSYRDSMESVNQCLLKFFPQLSETDRKNFLYSFFPFMFGIYPYTFVTEKQRESMELANVGFVYQTAYEIIYGFVRKHLEAML